MICRMVKLQQHQQQSYDHNNKATATTTTAIITTGMTRIYLFERGGKTDSEERREE